MVHSEKNFHPETLRKIWEHSEISRDGYLTPLGYHARLVFFFLYKFHVISGVPISGYQANRLSAGKSFPGFGKKHEPKEVNHTHKITGALRVMYLMDPSVSVI